MSQSITFSAAGKPSDVPIVSPRRAAQIDSRLIELPPGTRRAAIGRAERAANSLMGFLLDRGICVDGERIYVYYQERKAEELALSEERARKKRGTR
jgi:hypothetical protein